MTERELQKAVIDLAHMFGWMVAHFRPAQTARGWRTPVEGDGKGFPDLLMLRERILVREMKVGRNPLSPEQTRWIERFRAAGIDADVWREWELQGRIVDELRAYKAA